MKTKGSRSVIKLNIGDTPTDTIKKPVVQNKNIIVNMLETPLVEPLCLRAVAGMKVEHTNIQYVSKNTLAMDLLNQLQCVDRCSDQVLNDQSSQMITTNDLLDSVKGMVQGLKDYELNIKAIKYETQSFIQQWLSDLPRPYVGVCWSVRDSQEIEHTDAGIDLVELAQCFNNFKGSVIILQKDVTVEEKQIIEKHFTVPVLDCSDMLDQANDALTVLDILDDFICVPNVLHEIRNSLKKPSRLFWISAISQNFSNDSIQKLYPDDRIYFSNEIDGWKNTYELIAKDFKDVSLTGNIPVKEVLGSSSSSSMNEPKSKSEKNPKNVTQLIQHCATKIQDVISDQDCVSLLEMSDAFNKKKSQSQAPVNIFVYHYDMSEDAKLVYFYGDNDAIENVGEINYSLVLKTFLKAIEVWLPQANVYLVTGKDSSYEALESSRVKVVYLDVSKETPMYSRVQAMYAYVHSNAFNQDTVFLDSDAFVNKKITDYLDSDFDIALTVRDTKSLMPINEGVIIAKYLNPNNVRKFFKRYLSTYHALIDDEMAKKAYTDIRRWRGGQLSLNAIGTNLLPYSPYRQIEVSSIRLRSLPCDMFNYYWEYNQKGLTLDVLKEKVVIHLKGGRKGSMEELCKIFDVIWRVDEVAGSDAPRENPQVKGPHIEPYFATFNKMYQEQPFSDRAVRQDFINHLGKIATPVQANREDSGALLADDMFVWFRNLGFLTEHDFTKAFEQYAQDKLLRARIWRIYMLCWGLRSCMKVEGDCVDLGCYDGRTVDIMLKYANFSEGRKSYYLYDLFENPTPESRKSKHGPNLYNEVVSLFSDYESVKVIKGPVPHSFEQGLPEKIAFAQIDLNEADAEMAVLPDIYDRVTPGGMIIFDDFGFKRYSQSHQREWDFFRQQGDVVFECPTGQGLFIKRG